jgi:hypothetical protein
MSGQNAGTSEHVQRFERGKVMGNNSNKAATEKTSRKSVQTYVAESSQVQFSTRLDGTAKCGSTGKKRIERAGVSRMAKRQAATRCTIEHPQKIEGANGITATKINMDEMARLDPSMFVKCMDWALKINELAEASSEDYAQSPQLLTEFYSLSNGGIFLYPLGEKEIVTLKDAHGESLKLAAVSSAAALCTLFWNHISWHNTNGLFANKTGEGYVKLYLRMLTFMFSQKSGAKDLPDAAKIMRFLD